jgi:hypothetical protein
MAATACLSAIVLGRSFNLRAPTPAPIAPELTIATVFPIERRRETLLAKFPTRATSIPLDLSARRVVPILMTTRLLLCFATLNPNILSEVNSRLRSHLLIEDMKNPLQINELQLVRNVW